MALLHRLADRIEMGDDPRFSWGASRRVQSSLRGQPKSCCSCWRRRSGLAEGFTKRHKPE